MIYNEDDVLGFKTDTVWGMGAHPLNKEGVEKIYEIKGRDRLKPLILMSNDIKNLLVYVKNIPNYAQELIEKHFPGGLTLIFEKTEACPLYITSGQNTVGIRVPNSEDFSLIAENFEGKVLATTSLNHSNELPVKNYEEAKSKFGNLIKIVKPKDKSCPAGLASTVVLCTNKEPKILRQGELVI